MRLATLVLTVLLSILSAAQSEACPKGPRDQELSISSVMRNFGRFLLPADSLATRGKQDPRGVSDKEFATAIDGIGVALSCVHAVLNDPQGALWPVKASNLPTAEREAYLKIYFGQMQNFGELLTTYQKEFTLLRTTQESERDFTNAARIKDQVRDAARQAHDATK